MALLLYGLSGAISAGYFIYRRLTTSKVSILGETNSKGCSNITIEPLNPHLHILPPLLKNSIKNFDYTKLRRISYNMRKEILYFDRAKLHPPGDRKYKQLKRPLSLTDELSQLIKVRKTHDD